MKKIMILFSLITITAGLTQAQTSFDFEPGQCMLMTGKGPGQDGTINPYYGEECIAVVENIGNCLFYIRIESKGISIERELKVLQGETKEIRLLKGHELYIDGNLKNEAQARVSYRSI